MTGEETKKVQAYLQGLGMYPGKIDGIAGPMTLTGVRQFQMQNGLKADGVVGPITWKAMFNEDKPTFLTTGNFYVGTGTRLDNTDIQDLANDIDCEFAAIKAVIAVEAAGHGFDSKGRVTCLYEPHVAYRLADVTSRQALVKAGLAYVRWGTKPYPRSMDTRFKQIDECSEIAGSELAARSTSWGLPQIMGFNYEAAGYSNAVEMVMAFAADERNQIFGMGSFILNNANIHHALQRKDWPAFAEGYNGKGFRTNKYDIKLADAYQRYQKDPNAD